MSKDWRLSDNTDSLLNDLRDNWVETGFGDTADSLSELFKATEEHYKMPVVRRNLEDRFLELATTWQHDHMFTSDLEKIAMHPTYQEIIGMGERVLPLIFRQLQIYPHYWFAALEAITGVDPVDEVARGNIPEMAHIWLEWAYKEGYLNGSKIYTPQISTFKLK